MGCLSLQERGRELQEEAAYLYGRGDYSGARECYEAALSAAPDNANLLYNIGQCCDRAGDWKRAEAAFNSCLAQDPEHTDCRFALVTMLYEAGRKEDAQRLIDQWLEAAPNQAAPYVADGWRLRQQGDIVSAQARVHQGLARDSHYVRGLVELAIIYEQLDRPSRALALYERALAENPRQAELTSRVKELRSQKVGRPLPN